jgi:hypothetical protein
MLDVAANVDYLRKAFVKVALGTSDQTRNQC